MDWLIWIGAAVSLAGVGGLFWCVMIALRARNAGLTDDQLRAKLQGAVVLNMAALMVAALGLMMVVAGIFLA